MKLICSRALIAALLLFFCASATNATSHVFVRAQDGVWLASDSLNTHNNGGKIIKSHICKVAISKGQMFFNAGYFKDAKFLLDEESELPFASMDITKQAVSKLLETNHMSLSPEFFASHPKLLIVNTGILQVENSVFRASMIGQTEDGYLVNRWIKEFQLGVPHGYGDTVNRVREQAAHNPAVASRIAANPKQELLKILEEEAIMRNGEVEGPFTVLLLHNDGTVSDFSDHPLCTIPEDAQHVETPKPTTHASCKTKRLRAKPSIESN